MIHEVILEIEDEDFKKYGLDGCREIIRCKDCRWKYGTNCVRFAEVSVKADDYCSRGERKHNGKE